MKKLLLILTTLITTTTSTLSSLISCSGKPELKIIFVPSRDASKLKKAIEKLKPLLEDKLKNFNMKVEANVSTDYTTAGQSLRSGTVDVSFLPAATYNKFRGKKNNDKSYDATAILLSPTRGSIIADCNVFKENINENWFSQIILPSDSLNLAREYKKSLINVNNRKDAVEKLYKKDCDSPYYRIVIYANKDFLQKNKFDITKINTEKEYCKLMKKNISTAINEGKLYLGSANSSAGRLYPLNWMRNTLKFSDEEDLKKVIKNTKIYNSYTDAVEKLVQGDAWISACYGDMRIDCDNADNIEKTYKAAEAIGVTDAVANDAIQYSRKKLGNNYELVKHLRLSFCELIQDARNSAIFDDIYDHKRYCKPDQNDEESSRKWEIEQDEIYTKIDNKLNDVLELQKKYI